MVSTQIIVYAGHFLSSWGDRMWYFAIPLFLLELDPASLFLTAAYGLTLSICVLLFAPLVGDWIDRRPRMYALTVCLLTQNLSVAISAVILVINREYGEKDSNYLIAVQLSAIAFGAVGKLASTGCQIMIQRDWIVVVAGGKTDFLANLNAMVRRIDLVTKIIAPLACGQIMTLTSLTGGAIFIVGWNLVSMCTEYYFMRIVYKRTPALATKRSDDDDDEGEEMVGLNENGEQVANAENEGAESGDKKIKKKKKKPKKKKSVFRKMFGFIFVIKDGWKLYMTQTIVRAGVGLAFLFLTVLNFGYVMTSYAYQQCFSEFLVGILLAVSAVAGITGTFIFPVLRSKVGLVKTGVLSGIFQIITIMPCAASLWLSGSPFILYSGSHVGQNVATPTTLYEVLTTTVLPALAPTRGNITNQMGTVPDWNMTTTSLPMMYNTTEADDGYLDGLSPRIFFKCLKGVMPPPSFLSLSMLLGGVLVSRAGLWSFDLTVTQLIQENVAETERGIINGVQQSLSMSMDMIGYVLVCIFPLSNYFGILILVSTVAIIVAHALYGTFAYKADEVFNAGGRLAKKKAKKVEEEPAVTA